MGESEKPAFGMVHGRFQPFHNGHMDYVKKAMARCGHLVIGITNPDPFAIEQESSSAHRHLSESNPFTFFSAASDGPGGAFGRRRGPDPHYSGPFLGTPPGEWPYYLPPPGQIVQFIRVFSDWEQTKADRLRDNGFAVEVLDRGSPKEYAGVDVRDGKAAGDGWKRSVPPAVAEIIEEVRDGRL